MATITLYSGKINNRVGRKWEVYFSEKGQKTDQVFFDSEHDACEYLFSIAKKIEAAYRNCIIIK